MCGEPPPPPSTPLSPGGPSPRVRGNRYPGGHPLFALGSIPACAGKPMALDAPLRTAGVHPRVCGETSRAFVDGSLETGPSPRVRGNLRERKTEQERLGSIPACAGKPCTAGIPSWDARVHPRVCGETRLVRRGQLRNGVHPRVCGETATRRDTPSSPWGPSPRVRGNPGDRRRHILGDGSIPACAGKPRGSW